MKCPTLRLVFSKFFSEREKRKKGEREEGERRVKYLSRDCETREGNFTEKKEAVAIT